VSTDRSGRLLPLLEKCLGDLALQLVCGLLPGQTGAVAHFYRVLARALNLGFLGVSGRNRHQQDTKQQQALHRVLERVMKARYGRWGLVTTAGVPRVSMDSVTSPPEHEQYRCIYSCAMPSALPAPSGAPPEE
jgi:hypothetical protein